MPGNLLRLIAGAVCPLLLWSCLASAQNSGAAGPPAAAEPPPPGAAEALAVRESLPKVYYLPDKDGKLRPVLDLPFEEFEQAYRLIHGLAPGAQRPRYVLRRLSVTGRAAAEHAAVTIQVDVLGQQADWVRVPLRLDQAILQGPAEYQGPGEHFLAFEEGGEGYVVWFRGEAGQGHELTLKMLLPLASIGEESRLRLFAPRALASELKLVVPVAKAVGKVSEDAVLDPPVDAAGGATELTARRLGGDFQLTWHRPGGRVAEPPTILEADGEVLVRIDNRSVLTEATLSVRSSGGPFDRFRVRLPPGAQWVPGNAADYTVTPDPGAPEKDWVEVGLAGGKTTGPVQVRLATTRSQRAAKPNQPLELAGFEVAGAVRQRGHVAVAPVGELQVLWNPSRGLRRVEQLPDSLRHQDVVAGFEYFVQPCSLTARLESRKTRINVEPEYLLLVDPDQVRLEAKLKYRFRGAKAYDLYVALPGWEFDAVEPANLVAVDRVDVSEAGVLSIPLAQPSAAPIELLVRAHRTMEQDGKSLALSLPQPQDHSPVPATVTAGPAAVIVAPADNVELTPDNESMQGLTRQEVTPEIDLERQQAPLFYRSESADAVVAFDYRIRAQSIKVAVTSRLVVERDACRVEETLAYTIGYEPAHHFVVTVPRGLAASGPLEFRHDGQPVTPMDVPGTADPQETSKPLRKQIDLTEACIGLCELVVRYPLPPVELFAGQAVPLAVPLVMPADGELSANELQVSAAPEIKVTLAKGPWTASQPDAVRADGRRGPRLTADGRAETAELNLVLEEQNGEGDGTMVVERAWVQTWLTRSVRQDRAVFSFVSRRKALQPIIPTGAAIGQMEVWLNGNQVRDYAVEGLVDGNWQPLERAADAGGKMGDPPGSAGVKQVRLNIPVADENRRRHVLELRFHFPQRRPQRGPLSIEIPRLGRDVWVRRMYWQLVLPQNEHVVSSPEGFISEFTWGWNGYSWGRKALMKQSELEAWVGARRLDPLPEGTNRYLFSSFGNVGRCELRSAGRSWIVLGASGAALVGGLLLIYVPLARRLGTLFGAGVVLLCVGMVYPEPTLLLSQAASLGLALALLAGLLERTVARRRRGVTPPEPASAILEEGSTKTQYQPPLAADEVPAPAAPSLEPPSSPDSNP